MQTLDEWLVEFKGKTIRHMRTLHKDNSVVPSVEIEFIEGDKYEVLVREGAFFEGCMLNTLRKAQPVVDVTWDREGADVCIEVSAETFPLFILLATNKKAPLGTFPFWLQSEVDDA